MVTGKLKQHIIIGKLAIACKSTVFWNKLTLKEVLRKLVALLIVNYTA